jgi:PAT family beta-lactamase induction signal transducer AmpG
MPQAPPKATLREVYLNRRMAALLALGFASGLPSANALLGNALQAWLGSLDYSVKELGLTRLVTLPIALHFLWAPLLDHYEPLRGLGRRRGWLLVIQLALIAAILGMAAIGPWEKGASTLPLLIMAAVVAFLSSSQDTVADAYRADVLLPHEMPAGAAVFVNGYRGAMLLASGGALALSKWLPWPVVYALLSGAMVVGLLGTWLAPPPPVMATAHSLKEAVLAPMQEFFRRRGAAGAAVLLFIVVFKLPDALGNAMVMPLLQKHLKFDPLVLGLREPVSLAAVIIGTLAGGGLAAKLGLLRSLWLFAVLQAVSNAGFLVLAQVGASVPAMLAVTFVESLCAGLVTAGFIGFLMAQCNRQYTATQYALFTSLMFVSSSLMGSVTGFLVERMGYVSFFAVTIAAAAPGMAMLAWLGSAGVGFGEGERTQG